ncbi:MAG: ATP-grasp domain-containing protein [Ardenticatenaceae bacterium]|nr:ATP-grasp domain-containing protein [Ardenticatenaceae bacterium]
MIILDEPYVSDFLLQTIRDHELPIVLTDTARALGFGSETYCWDVETAVSHLRTSFHQPIYTNSENAIGWVAQHLDFTGLPGQIAQFKDKVKFRELIRPLYPHFFFRQIALRDFAALDITHLPLPFVIKPTAGFFSLAVHKVSSAAEWEAVKTNIQLELMQTRGLFPREVINTTSFIIEECIEGDEYAIDAYFDAAGKPVILNILKHIFSSASDVSDRIYISSKEIVETHLARFTDFLAQLGRLTGVQNFPVHVEVRLDAAGQMQPIEVNPLRFGGWCTTPDMTAYAYGFNPYLYFLRGQRPDWGAILADKAGKLYSLIILDNSTGLAPDRIAAFDYERVLAQLEKPLQLRRLDYRRFPVFGFIFAETQAAHYAELDAILKSDLREFVVLV